jgi:deazaflavin-dependent oxidoreductase (nitroreductase family)
VSDFDQQVIDALRTSGGVLTEGPLAGQQLLLVTHRGARTGTVRTTPLGYYDDVGTPVVFASGMGAPVHPQWVFNLRVHPHVAVEINGEAFAATAREVEGKERESLWTRVIEEKSFLVEHQQRAEPRQIPLIRLETT